MKINLFIPFIGLAMMIGSCSGGAGDQQSSHEAAGAPSGPEEPGEPWKSGQLMEPAELAKVISDAEAVKPIIYSIGPAGDIKGNRTMGPAEDPANLERLKASVSELERDADILLYCGCCPFVNCPNIRPAFQLLNDMGFTNHRLLNLSENIKVDWIDKGYPMD
jgi:thiosulfate/3-mercaptopyruvate sulfurtransferase